MRFRHPLPEYTVALDRSRKFYGQSSSRFLLESSGSLYGICRSPVVAAGSAHNYSIVQYIVLNRKTILNVFSQAQKTLA